MKLLGHDADNRYGMAVVEDGFAYDAGIAAAARLPEGVAQDHNGVQRRDGAFRRKKEAAEQRLNAERTEEIAADVKHDHGFGFSVNREATFAELLGDDIGEDRRGLFLEILKFGIRKGGLECAFFQLHTEHGKLLGIFDGKRPQEKRIDHAEDGGVGADAEAKSEDGDGREAEILIQHSEAEANVLERRFD